LDVGPREEEFKQLLDSAGLKHRQRVPCGTYSLNFTLTKYPIAVEIRSGRGNHNAAGNRKARLKYVLNQWCLLEINFKWNLLEASFKGGCNRAMGNKIIKNLISFVDFCRSDKSTRSQYRMVRPNGDTVTPGKNMNGRPYIPSPDNLQ
jgi:hypothetical protein